MLVLSQKLNRFIELGLEIDQSNVCVNRDYEKAYCLAPNFGHSDRVTSVIFSHDGKFIISGSADHTIKVWDFATAKVVRTIGGHNSYIKEVLISSDDSFILSCSGFDNEIKIWDFSTGKLLKSITEWSDVNSMAISPNNIFLATGTDDSSVKIWNIAENKLIKILEGHSGWVSSLAFSPCGKYLISGSLDETIIIWDFLTGKRIGTLTGHTGSVRSLIFSPNGNYIISGGLRNDPIKIWKFSSLELLYNLTIDQIDIVSIDAISISPDENYILCGSLDTMLLWNLNNGELLDIFWHKSKVSSVAFSPDGKHAISSSDNAIIIWNIFTKKLVKTLNGHSIKVNALAVSPDGRFIATALNNNTILIWNRINGSIFHRFEGYNKIVNALAISPNLKYLISGSNDNSIRIWDLVTKNNVRTLAGHRDFINSISITPDSKYIISGSNDQSIKIWDIETGGLIKTLVGHNEGVKYISLSMDGTFIVSTSEYSIKVWSFSTGDLITSIRGCFNCACLFSPENNHIIYNEKWSPSNINIFDFNLMKIVKKISKEDAINTITVSSDGKYVAIANDNTIKVFDFLNNCFCGSFQHLTSVKSVEFIPKSPLLVGGDIQSNIIIWDFLKCKKNTIDKKKKKTVPFEKLIPYPKSFFPNKVGLITGMHLGSEIKPLQKKYNGIISHDGKFVLLNFKRNIWIYDTEIGELKSMVECQDKDITHFAISSDRMLICAGVNNSVIIWDLRTGNIKFTLEAHINNIVSLKSSTNNNLLVSASNLGTCGVMIIWNLLTGGLLNSFYIYNTYINSVSISPNGKYVACGCENGIIKILEVSTGEVCQTIKGHKSIRLLEFSPKVDYIISGDHKTVKLWSFNTGELIYTFLVEVNVRFVKISHDGKYIAYVDKNGIMVWCTDLNNNYGPFRNFLPFLSIRFIPKTNIIIAVDFGGNIFLWNFLKGKKNNHIQFQINNYLMLKLEKNMTNIYINGKIFRQCKYLFLINPQNKEAHDFIDSIDEAEQFLSGDLERKLTPKDFGILPLEEFYAHCSNLQAWYENGYDSRILHRNLAFPLLKALTQAGDLQAKKSFKEEISERLKSGYPPVLGFLREENYFDFLSEQEFDAILNDINFNIDNIDNSGFKIDDMIEKTSHNFKLKNGKKILARLNYEISLGFRKKTLYFKEKVINTKKLMSLILSPNGKYLVGSFNNGFTKIWDFSSGNLLETYGKNLGYVSYLIQAFSNDDNYIINIYNNEWGGVDSVKLMEISKGKYIRTYFDWSADFNPDVWINSVSCHKKFFVSHLSNHSIEIWDVMTGELLRTTGEYKFSKYVISPNGNYIISVFDDKTIRICNLLTGEVIRTLENHKGNVELLSISSDEKYLACSTLDHIIKIWEFNNGKLVQKIMGGVNRISDIIFSPKNNYFISESYTEEFKESFVQVWELVTGKLVSALEGRAYLDSAVISPNEKYIVSAVNSLRPPDYSIKLWELSTGKLIQQLYGHEEIVFKIIFSSDGNYLISSSNDKIIKWISYDCFKATYG